MNELVDVAQATVQTLTVLAGMSLSERITAGLYDEVNPLITESRFYKPASGGRWECKLFHFQNQFGMLSSKTAESKIIEAGWEPALIEQLLAFGAKYPDEQKKYPIVGLGSWCFLPGGDDKYVLSLATINCRRNLEINNGNGRWLDFCRFLAVRKEV